MQSTRLPLQNVTLEVWLHHPRQLDFSVWDDIEATLSSVPFEKVRNVLFIHRGDLEFVVARSDLNTRFGTLAQKGTLTVRDCSMSPFI